MTQLFSPFAFQESKLTLLVWAFAAVIWIAILACALSSIAAQPFSRRQRTLWIALIVCVPIFGLLAYLPFSIRRDELPTAFLIRGSAKDRKKRGPRIVTPHSR